MHLSYGVCGLRARVQLKTLSSLLKLPNVQKAYAGITHILAGKYHWVQHRGFGCYRQIFDEFPDCCLAISSSKPAFHTVTLLQGNRSVYLLNLDTESSSNELTVETHPVKSRLVVCAANVSPAADI